MLNYSYGLETNIRFKLIYRITLISLSVVGFTMEFLEFCYVHWLCLNTTLSNYTTHQAYEAYLSNHTPEIVDTLINNEEYVNFMIHAADLGPHCNITNYPKLNELFDYMWNFLRYKSLYDYEPKATGAYQCLNLTNSPSDAMVEDAFSDYCFSDGSLHKLVMDAWLKTCTLYLHTVTIYGDKRIHPVNE